MNRRHLLILGMLLLSGCAAPIVYASPDAGMVELEPLLGARVDADALTIRVASSGCTTKDGFAFFVERRYRRVAVAFGRKRLDVCRAAPTAIDLTWSFAELGLPKGAVVTVVNPLAAKP
ncbi:MAG: hypothetical protein V4466_06305 [Pseudomonadota bacterium]